MQAKPAAGVAEFWNDVPQCPEGGVHIVQCVIEIKVLNHVLRSLRGLPPIWIP